MYRIALPRAARLPTHPRRRTKYPPQAPPAPRPLRSDRACGAQRTSNSRRHPRPLRSDRACGAQRTAGDGGADVAGPRRLARADRAVLFGASTDALPLSLSRRKLMLVGIGAVQVPQAEFGPSTRQMGPTDRAVMVSCPESAPPRDDEARPPAPEVRGPFRLDHGRGKQLPAGHRRRPPRDPEQVAPLRQDRHLLGGGIGTLRPRCPPRAPVRTAIRARTEEGRAPARIPRRGAEGGDKGGPRPIAVL